MNALITQTLGIRSVHTTRIPLETLQQHYCSILGNFCRIPIGEMASVKKNWNLYQGQDTFDL